MEHVPETSQEARARLQNAACAWCLYFKSAGVPGDTPVDGQCRFRPPVMSGSGFPRVLADDWCGEYLARD